LLTLTSKRIGETFSLSLEGELALETVDQFATFTAAVDPDVRKAVIDCTGLTFLDSTGTNALLQIVLQWKRAGREVHVCHLSEDLHEMLDILGFFELLGESA
jgi:anti-anti-sigma factor